MFERFRRRRLSPEAGRRLQIAIARSQEVLIDAHVANAIDLLQRMGDELDEERAMRLYVEALGLPESLADVVRTRFLARLGEPDVLQ